MLFSRYTAVYRKPLFYSGPFIGGSTRWGSWVSFKTSRRRLKDHLCVYSSYFFPDPWAEPESRTPYLEPYTTKACFIGALYSSRTLQGTPLRDRRLRSSPLGSPDWMKSCLRCSRLAISSLQASNSWTGMVWILLSAYIYMYTYQ